MTNVVSRVLNRHRLMKLIKAGDLSRIYIEGYTSSSKLKGRSVAFKFTTEITQEVTLPCGLVFKLRHPDEGVVGQLLLLESLHFEAGTVFTFNWALSWT